MNNLLEKIYNPDVLSCLANLSNDEVFTPPEVANKMIDLLPKELFESDKTTFLDPCCKSGVFLREIMKRILNAKFPNYEEKIALINEKKMNKEKLTNEEMQYEKALQEKIDWVCHNQLYGISITRLTSLLSRRSLYCSKNANSKYSISKFDTDYGHIMYVDMKHTFKNGKCIYCGASESEYGEEKRGEELESHAYQFIHDENIVEGFNMKFDVIIGNPPYQLGDGGAGASAKPIYQHFINTAKKLNPKYITMIIPSRWFAGGKGLDDFRSEMLKDRRLKYIIDFPNAKDCFPENNVSGGVMYFLWDKHWSGDCQFTNVINNKYYTEEMKLNEFEIFVRYNKAISIIHKVINKTDKYLSEIITSRKPFGLNSYDRGDTNPSENKYKLLSSDGISYINKTKVSDVNNLINKYKVIFGKALSGHIGETDESGKVKVLAKLDLLKPNEVCTESYICVGGYSKKEECENLLSYMKTKFVRFLLLQALTSMNITKDKFMFVPCMDFKNRYEDKDLYKIYKLSDSEIEFIEGMVKEWSDKEDA